MCSIFQQHVYEPLKGREGEKKPNPQIFLNVQSFRQSRIADNISFSSYVGIGAKPRLIPDHVQYGGSKVIVSYVVLVKIRHRKRKNVSVSNIIV